MTLLVFLGLPLLATAGVAIAAPPLMAVATLLALAWAAIGWSQAQRRAAATPAHARRR